MFTIYIKPAKLLKKKGYPMDENLQLNLFQTIKTLAVNAGFKDNRSFNPQKNISQIARTIAQIMDIKNDEIQGIRLAATLLDVGMLNIPLDILHKPSKLTEQEYNIIKQHPVQGYQLLREIEFPWPVARMVLQHQERCDGTGYPAGFVKDDIMIEARIIGVADVINSMTSDRPWRKALSVDETMAELKENRGKKYDEDVVDAAIELYTKQAERLTEAYYGREY
jgi:HD-GYP domain-containing protein (c-di-GMP phosphodiesterase class II)